MGVAYEKWEAWVKAGGSMPFFAWCDARDRLALLNEATELRKVLENKPKAAPAAVEKR